MSDTPDEHAAAVSNEAEVLADEAASPTKRRRQRKGRRPTEQPRDPRGPLFLLALAAILVVVVGLGSLVPRASVPAATPGVVEPVDSSTAVCPEPGALEGQSTTSAMTVVSGLPGQDRTGAAEVTYLQGPDDTEAAGLEPPDVTLASPGDSGQVVAEERRLPPLSVVTTGSLAPGLVAAESTLDLYDEYRGLASTACLGPDTSWWFVGGGSTAGRETNLILVNPEATAAELDVTIAGPNGEVSTPSLRGLVVESKTRVVIRMAKEAPRLPFAAWHVNVRAGRVVAAVFDSEMAGYVPRGADWVPPSADPATRVYVPGIIPGEGGRQLLVYNPGADSTTVKARFITAKGSFVPTDLPAFDVAAGSVAAVDLDKSLEGDAITLELTADAPVVAGVRQRHPGIDATDYSLEEESFAGSAVLVNDVAAVSGLPSVQGSGATLWITAPSRLAQPDSPLSADQLAAGQMSDDTSYVADDSPVTVTIRILPFGAPEAEPITVTVQPDRMVGINIPKPDGADWYTAVVTPIGGPVVIAHRAVVKNPNGSLITGYPWRPLRTTVVVPTAAQDPGLALPSP